LQNRRNFYSKGKDFSIFPKQESRHFDDLARKDVQPLFSAAHLIKKIRKRFLVASIKRENTSTSRVRELAGA
jgi:hypothetical protein